MYNAQVLQVAGNITEGTKLLITTQVSSGLKKLPLLGSSFTNKSCYLFPLPRGLNMELFMLDPSYKLDTYRLPSLVEIKITLSSPVVYLNLNMCGSVQ